MLFNVALPCNVDVLDIEVSVQLISASTLDKFNKYYLNLFNSFRQLVSLGRFASMRMTKTVRNISQS